jgi:hypothetical protein
MNQVYFMFVAFAAFFALAIPASAQDDGEMGFGDIEEPAPGEEPAQDNGEENEEDSFLAGEQTEEEKLLAKPTEEADTGLHEDPETKYFSLGLRLRWVMIPQWFIGMFGVDIETNDGRHLLINNVGIGPEFTYRKDGFDITAAIWYMGMGWKDTVAFKGDDEDGGSWEVVTNDLKSLLITVDFIWSTSITDWFAITYGAGLGLGIPIGDIVRTESAENQPLVKCSGPSDTDAWCNAGEEYGEVYDLPTGIVPWVNFLFGMRFKPHRHVAIYADAGFGLGFQTGLRASYIF